MSVRCNKNIIKRSSTEEEATATAAEQQKIMMPDMYAKDYKYYAITNTTNIQLWQY